MICLSSKFSFIEKASDREKSVGKRSGSGHTICWTMKDQKRNGGSLLGGTFVAGNSERQGLGSRKEAVCDTQNGREGILPVLTEKNSGGGREIHHIHISKTGQSKESFSFAARWKCDKTGGRRI